MMTSANRGAGQNVNPPDVCLTPPVPVPVPYVNIAPHAMAVPFSPHVMICGLPALNQASVIPLTLGDEPGTAHPVDMQTGTFAAGAPNIFVDMVPAIHLVLPTIGNAANAPIGGHVVPDVVNVYFNDAEAKERAAEGITADLVQRTAERLRVGARPEVRALSDGILYVRAPVLTDETPTHLHNAIAAHPEAASLVLDLRGCPGGALEGAIRVAQDFLSAGDVVARYVEEDGDETVVTARADGPYRMKVALLIDQNTASAAEVLVAALSENQRAVTVGRRTHGKASVERFQWKGGELLYATVARCLLPGGGALEPGIAPDIHVPCPEDGSLDDATLGAALRALGEL